MKEYLPAEFVVLCADEEEEEEEEENDICLDLDQRVERRAFRSNASLAREQLLNRNNSARNSPDQLKVHKVTTAQYKQRCFFPPTLMAPSPPSLLDSPVVDKILRGGVFRNVRCFLRPNENYDSVVERRFYSEPGKEIFTQRQSAQSFNKQKRIQGSSQQPRINRRSINYDLNNFSSNRGALAKIKRSVLFHLFIPLSL